MAKKETNKKKTNNYEFESGLQSQTKHGILAIIFFVLALFFLMAWFDSAGVAGKFLYEKLNLLLGVGYVLLPALCMLLGSSFVKSETPNIGWPRTVSAVLFLLSGLGIIDVASATHAGGLLGEILSTPLVYLFDKIASIVFLGAILIISILIMFDASLNIHSLLAKLRELFSRKTAPEIAKGKEVPVVEAEEDIEEDEDEETETTGEKIKKALGVGKNKKEEALKFSAL